MKTLQFHQLEDIYDELAQAIDDYDEGQESVFLAQLVLRLAKELGDAERVSELIVECGRRQPACAAGAGADRIL